MIKLSVCISVHNTAKLLPRCLDSILAQTYKNIEIIIINNGSTDNSHDIMKSYQKENANVFVYEQSDLGLAQGRQSGVNHATGDYIAFLDADDYVLPEMYEKMLAIAEQTDADIVECQTSRNGVVLSSPYKGLYHSQDVLRDYFAGEPILSMLWIRVYKSALFEKPVFPEFYINNEDIFALPCLLKSASTIYFMNECLHVYSDDNEQAEMCLIRKKIYDDERILAIKIKALQVISHVQNFLGKTYIEQYYKKEFNYYISRNITYFCVADYKKVKSKKIMEVLCNFMEMSEDKLNRFYVDNINKPVLFEKIAVKVGIRMAIPIYRRLITLKKWVKHE